MTRVNPPFYAFNGGEVGQDVLARADLQTYTRVAATLENIIPEVQGGMSKRPGTEFLADITTDTDGVHLIPWVFDETNRFILYLADESARLVFDTGFVVVDAADATLGSWSDESGAVSSGGGAPSDGGTGDIDPNVDINIDPGGNWEIDP